MNCGQCGNSIKEQGKFCGKCGRLVPATQPVAQTLDQNAETVAAAPRQMPMAPAVPLGPPPGLPPDLIIAAPWPPAGNPPLGPPPGPPPGTTTYTPAPVPRGLLYGGLVVALLLFGGVASFLLNRTSGGSATETPSAQNFVVVDFTKSVGSSRGLFDPGDLGYPAAVVDANLQTKLAATDGWRFPTVRMFGMSEYSHFLRCASLIDGKNGLVVMDALGELHRDPSLVPINCTGQYPAPARSNSAAINGPCTYINREWARLTPEEFVTCAEFKEGLARVAIGQLYGYINTTGKIAIPPRFQRALDFHQGRALASESGDRFGLINTAGQFTVPERFTEVLPFNDGLAFVRLGPRGKFGAIGVDGNLKIEPRFERVVYGFENGVAWVVNPGTNYPVLIDKAGREIPTPRYSRVSEFENGVSIVGTGLWGLIGTNGKEILSPRYDKIRPFRFGLAAVASGNRQQEGFIDRSGKLVVPLEEGGVHDFVGKFGYRLTKDSSGNLLQVLIDRSGREAARLSNGKIVVGGGKP